jgi:Nucleotidyl transferase AbiEii toxin, Type IV TA system
MSADRAASALARLLNRSRSTGENYNLLLSRFVIERLLFRLSVSPHAGNFVLKGALLFALWYDTPHQPTKDADLLGFGADDADTLRATFSAVCAIDANDGVRYDTQGMKLAPVREDNVYDGTRLSLLAFVGSARLPVQVDIGFGDAITPALLTEESRHRMVAM